MLGGPDLTWSPCRARGAAAIVRELHVASWRRGGRCRVLKYNWEFNRQAMSRLGLWTEGSSRPRNHADKGSVCRARKRLVCQDSGEPLIFLQ